MKNSDRYHFSDFTHENYRNLIKIGKEHYTFGLYKDYHEISNVLLWRHDIDYSLHAALHLAQIEAEEGVKATYFILLHANFYNIFEREIADLVIQIKNLGHEIGLHFDSHFYGISEEKDLEKYLLFEKNILQEMFDTKVEVFSFHNTNSFTMACQAESYGGLINVYSKNFQDNFGYCSDSNGYWRYERLEDVLKSAKYPRLQVLTHPGWWQKEVMSPKQRIWHCIEGRANYTKSFYEKMLQAYGRELIEW